MRVSSDAGLVIEIVPPGVESQLRPQAHDFPDEAGGSLPTAP